ncbi:hypothetical protein DICPUDRAFT_158532 [Dictyostelium purpureum]|uniref:EF-hand domain-containing protein n=1 Tax=Dictyostelium purpureum TaxID=5786 RepID=F1A1U4_DICPU|nr:uncharacterized protein DICPUDRAFT_158532 [Dictyostelium purpureum]EGC29837.1 hypothetical protein DICPUDRAFT_158532 [Dictyostelium purpureum]|eukprot:XP_003293635.1 hypothetical protein DICPUDRAFT_158532 [Dictyostelium purpureum]
MVKANDKKLTDDQITEISEAFELFKNNEGKIDIDQIKYAFRALGIEEPTKNIVKNNQKSITYNTFLELVSPLIPKRDRLSTLEQAFKLFDKDDSGKITFEDLKSVAINLGEECTDKELREMIQYADQNDDGAVDKDDFFSLMTVGKKIL